MIGGVIVGSYGIFRQYKLQKQIRLLNAELSKLRDAGQPFDSIADQQDSPAGAPHSEH
ncbi:hypothetical protein D3C75_1355580 [compost metagenome]